ncbi:MAG: hypothetical protein FWC46_03485 [Actinomycetia bacterium]|nr:hypothetical protein [Actinomycetes bacterium]
MLKFAKKLLLVLGVLIVLAAMFLLLWQYTMSSFSLRNIVAAATSGNSSAALRASYFGTVNRVWLSAAAGVVGGLILGIGIGMPSATFHQRFEQRQAEAAQKAAEKETPK